MSYKWTTDFELTKPRPGAATKGGNTPRPRDYAGEYSASIPGHLMDNGEHASIAPEQGFRKELPRPSKPGYATVEYEPSDDTPTTQAAIYRTHM